MLKEKIDYLMVSCSSLPLPRPRSYQIAKLLLHVQGEYRLITSDYPTNEKLDTSLNEKCASLFSRKIIVKENRYSLPRKLYFKIIPGANRIPDDHVFWIREVCKSAKKMRQEIEPAIVVAFARPHTDLIIGMKLKEIFHVPLVVHYSDPWVDNPYVRLLGLERKINYYLEKKVMDAASLIMFTNKDQLQFVMKKYPEYIRKKAVVLNHCFDETLYGTGKGNTGKFVVSYVGNLYGHRSPKPFLDAVTLLLADKPELEETIQIDFFGQVSKEHKQLISHSGLERVVNICDFVPYLESLRVMRNSDLLLLIDAKSEHNIFFPSKIVDYIGAKRNILGITSQKGPSAEIIKEYGGHVFQHEQVNEIKECLLVLLTQCDPFVPNISELNKYAAPFVAQEFERLILPLRT